jgi:hypothetical protein
MDRASQWVAGRSAAPAGQSPAVDQLLVSSRSCRPIVPLVRYPVFSVHLHRCARLAAVTRRPYLVYSTL